MLSECLFWCVNNYSYGFCKRKGWRDELDLFEKAWWWWLSWGIKCLMIIWIRRFSTHTLTFASRYFRLDLVILVIMIITAQTVTAQRDAYIGELRLKFARFTLLLATAAVAVAWWCSTLLLGWEVPLRVICIRVEVVVAFRLGIIRNVPAGWQGANFACFILFKFK